MGMSFPHCDVNDLEGLLWTHVSLLSLCAIFILASFNSQFRDAAPYGRHADPAKAKAWGFPIPQRVGHMISDAIPGIPLCLMVYLLYAGLLPPGGKFSEVRALNVVLLCGWLLHFLYRGIVHPLITAYSSKTVAVGITLAGIFPNTLFSYLIAAQLACTVYPDNWASQPRFIIGVVVYGVGTAINRWADLKLRADRLAMRRRKSGGPAQLDGGSTGVGGLGVGVGVGDGDPTPAAAVRESLLDTAAGGDDDSVGGQSGKDGGRLQPSVSRPQTAWQPELLAQPPQQADVRSHYFIPRGGLFELVSCPNYAGRTWGSSILRGLRCWSGAAAKESAAAATAMPRRGRSRTSGELLEWTGYALAVWSWPALAWALFCASTFIPRSLTNHRWYKQHFGSEYPPNRRALIPFIL